MLVKVYSVRTVATAFAVASIAIAANATGSRAEASPELIAAAQAEGSVVVYTASPIGAAEHTAKAFEEKFSIPVELLALPAGTLMQRLSSELEAGSFNADVIVGAGFDKIVTEQFVPKGWFVPIKTAGIPALDAGQYPSVFLNESTATLAYNPWTMAYNTDLVPEADAPTSFEDLSDPKYKNLVCTPNTGIAFAVIEAWDRILRAFGDGALSGVKDNEPKFYESVTATAAALAAGECAVAGPITGPAVAALPGQAPVKGFVPEVTYGTQMELGYFDPAKIAHPNAAKLFAQYLLTPEGNEQQAIVGGNVWVLNPASSPEQIAQLKAAPDVADRADHILTLLGRK